MTASKGHYETFTELLPACDPKPKSMSYIGSALKVVVLAVAFLEHGDRWMLPAGPKSCGCSHPEGRFS